MANCLDTVPKCLGSEVSGLEPATANVLGFRIVNLWNSMYEDIVTAPSTFSKDIVTRNMLTCITVLTLTTLLYERQQSIGPMAYIIITSH